VAEIRLKTVERAQLNFRLLFWSKIVQVGRIFFPNWPNFTQIGAKKPTMGRILASLDEI
jgi:hypothetical protein